MFGVRTRAAAIVLAPLSLAAAILFAGRARAQDPQQGVEAQRVAMAKLDYMAGNWRGSGWMERNGRQTFTGTERVQRKLDGLALLVEGDFVSSSEPGRSVHKTLAVMYYDPRTSTYRFDTWLAAGSHGEHELELLDDGWRWHLNIPSGTIRYTMRRGTNGQWFEIGERSADGKSWSKFFEMTLEKQTD